MNKICLISLGCPKNLVLSTMCLDCCKKLEPEIIQTREE